jgi:osmotically-inducible protein OsmY
MEGAKSDGALLEEARLALEAEPSIANEPIGLTVADGIVLLTGGVSSYAKKCTAEQVAARVPAVRGVVNALEIRRPFETPDTKLALAAIELLESIGVPLDQVKVNVTNHWLTLSGEVTSDEERRAAEEAVGHLAGLLGFSDNLVVRARRHRKKGPEAEKRAPSASQGDSDPLHQA